MLTVNRDSLIKVQIFASVLSNTTTAQHRCWDNQHLTNRVRENWERSCCSVLHSVYWSQKILFLYPRKLETYPCYFTWCCISNDSYSGFAQEFTFTCARTARNSVDPCESNCFTFSLSETSDDKQSTAHRYLSLLLGQDSSPSLSIFFFHSLAFA